MLLLISHPSIYWTGLSLLNFGNLSHVVSTVGVHHMKKRLLKNLVAGLNPNLFGKCSMKLTILVVVVLRLMWWWWYIVVWHFVIKKSAGIAPVTCAAISGGWYLRWRNREKAKEITKHKTKKKKPKKTDKNRQTHFDNLVFK